MTDEIRPLYIIAREILSDWGTRGSGVNYAALPYLKAMREMESVTDAYGADDGRGIVLRFLGNAGAWRGETAKRVKAELRQMVGTR